MQNVPPRSVISGAGLTAKVGQNLERERIERYLTLSDP